MITTQFEPWYALGEGAARAPALPGVYQIRVRTGLLTYPNGKSAMVHYASAPDLRAAITAYADAHPSADWLCRHQISPSADELCAQLLGQFVTRFGRRPGDLPD